MDEWSGYLDGSNASNEKGLNTNNDKSNVEETDGNSMLILIDSITDLQHGN